VLVELVGNGTVGEHRPVDGNELFDESGRDAMKLVSLRCRRNGVGNFGW